MSPYPQSWYDLTTLPPVDPRALIVNATLGGVQGVFYRSSNFMAGSAWVTSPFSFTGNVSCESLHTDDQLAVADAAQWTFKHKGGNFVSNIAPPVRKILFLRGGRQWAMRIPINLGAATYTDLQLSFRNNATSAGDFTGASIGTTPTILFGSALTGQVDLVMTLAEFGTYSLVISAREAANWSMFELECHIVE